MRPGAPTSGPGEPHRPQAGTPHPPLEPVARRPLPERPGVPRPPVEPVARRRPWLEAAALLLLLLIGIGATVYCSVLSRQASVYGTATPAAGSPVRLLSAAAAERLAAEAQTLLQSEAPADMTGTTGTTESARAAGSAWVTLLRTDPDALGLFLQRLATSPAYLNQGRSDPAFAEDFWRLLGAASVTGQSPSPTGQPQSPAAGQPPALASGQSRIAWLAQALTAAGFTIPGEWRTAGLLAPDDAGSPAAALGMLSLAPGTPASGSVIFGRRPFSGTITLASGSSGSLRYRALMRLDGRTVAATAVQDLSAAQAGFTFPLDVRGRDPGRYRVELLALGSDGRGLTANIGRLEIPMIDSLAPGAVAGLSLSVPAVGDPGRDNGDGGNGGDDGVGGDGDAAGAAEAARYAAIMPDKTGQGWRYALTVANPDSPVAAELYNLAGERIADCDNPGLRWEALRAVIPDDASVPAADRVAYVRISRSPDDAEPPPRTAFTLVQAEQVATPIGQPDQVLAVLGERNGQLSVQDMAGNRRTRPAAELERVTFTARLSELDIAVGTARVSIYPDFEAETDTFGLYLPADSGPLTIRAHAREGSFAEVSAAFQSGSAGAGASPAQLATTLNLPAPESTLTITVRSGGGETRDYRVHVLRAAQPGGFSETLEAFPESYRSALYLLHVRHPAYRFEADPVNLDFAAFVAAQSERDRSLVDAAVVSESWVRPGSPVYDGRSWKAATPVVVAHYGDPRNFLNERDVFQFEQLRFQPDAHDRPAVAAVINDSFMGADSRQNPDGIEYDRLLVEAGQAADISPLFLASRIVQEMGRTNVSPLAFGRLPGYEGVYNFYNIGATPNPSVPDGALINAARFALYGQRPDEAVITPEEAVYRLPWRTPESALTGGAIWIAQRYTAIGQDTLYLQKFDLVSADGLYTHQYAQNIQMAWAEGRRTQNAYRTAGLADQAFTFRIPVFQNLPEARSPLPDTGAPRIR